MLFGALEAGGTKMVCAIGNENGEILERISIPTETPKITMPRMAEFFKGKEIAALGIACFGPIDLNRSSETYGYITTTPKLPWKNYDICGYFRKELNIPVGFDTDVNGSMLGEATWGCAKGLDTAIYITIGTGVGVGVMAGGRLLHGMLHPEAGHILMPVRSDDTYAGKCPYHGTCLEGMAAGPAIEARWGAPAKELADRPEVWDLEAYYLAHALTSYIMILSPQKIIMGGGVMHQTQLMDKVRAYVKEMVNGYLVTKELEDLENYIVLPSLDDNQGIMGALKLGMMELELQK
ncbi:MAG: ROK family protein [Hungatella sp.]|jgi:fructokinase|nr:ROK family protein [Hungatella sp.]